MGAGREGYGREGRLRWYYQVIGRREGASTPNPSLHRTRASGLRPPARAGEL